MLSLTKEHKEKLAKYPTYSQDDKGENAEIVLKITNPYGKGTWYVLEAEPIHDNPDDYLFFGYVESPLGEELNEYGYFTYSELKDLSIPIYVQVNGELIHVGKGTLEIVENFDEKKMSDVLK